VESNAVLCLDLSDVRKEHARKMEFLDQVGIVASGKCTGDTGRAASSEPRSTAANSRSCTNNFSPCAQDFVSENDELLSAIDQLRAQIQGRGIWTVAETVESSWRRCWISENALPSAPPDSAWSSTGSATA
jgi:hypothetical protein